MEAKEGLARYQAFRKQFARANPGAGREALSAAWRAHKAGAPVLRPAQPAPVERDLEDELLDFFETDKKALHRELLNRSQASPSCYPYGLSVAELNDLVKLRETVRRVRRS
jgi:hypothetical protein